jgi:DnaJ like chaperone protein
MWKLLIILAAVLYSLSPVDLLPDYIIGWGWLDDIVVLVILWQMFVRFRGRFGQPGSGPARENENGRRSEPEYEQQASTPKSPHEVLGVSINATQDEIKHAYRQLAARYHPDKVSHLGEEFRMLAEKRFKEIQEAYQELSSQ